MPQCRLAAKWRHLQSERELLADVGMTLAQQDQLEANQPIQRASDIRKEQAPFAVGF